jgi:hypothetical protein
VSAASALGYVQSECRTVTIQQTDGESVFIDSDPGAAMVTVDWCNIPHTLTDVDFRGVRDAARPLLVPVAEELIPAGLL